MIIGSARIGPFCTMSMYGAPRSNASPEVAITTPICSRSSGSARSTPASTSASLPAATENCTKRALRRAVLRSR